MYFGSKHHSQMVNCYCDCVAVIVCASKTTELEKQFFFKIVDDFLDESEENFNSSRNHSVSKNHIVLTLFCFIYHHHLAIKMTMPPTCQQSGRVEMA